MSTAEILALVFLLVIALTIFVTYLFHGRKLTKKQKSEKKAEVKVVEVKTPESQSEQKPVPVGIIKEKKIEKVEDEIAPFKEVPLKVEEQVKVEKKSKESTIQDEIKSLSPEMKKVIMSDILKPRF